MQIFVGVPAGAGRVKAGQKLTLEAESDWSVDRLKEQISAEHGVLPAAQRLSVNSVVMVGDRKLADYEIRMEAELQLVERPPRPHAKEQGATDEELACLHGMSTGLRGRWAQVSEASRKLDEEKQALKQANAGGELEPKLELNVGGTTFRKVRRKTLTSVEESHLAELFSGRWEKHILTDSSGVMFLDCNPECFSVIIDFLKKRQKNPGAPGEPAQVPTVEEELVPTLHRLLDFFGLGHLFVAEEGVPPGEGVEPEPEPEPEPERGAEPEPEPEAQAPVQEERLLVAENDSVDLPARTIDHITEARYGSLDQEGKWIDVTRMLGQVVDEEGGLSLRVTSQGFGGDPAEGEEKQLCIVYKPCEAWEHESFESALQKLQQVADAERAALRRVVRKLRERQLDFGDEKIWVKYFLKAEGRQAAAEVVELFVGKGGKQDRVCVKRETLTRCAESKLARMFNGQEEAAAGGDGGEDDEDSDSDDDDEQTIDEDSACFRRMIDQLRLIAIAEPGDPPPPPIPRKHEEEGFAEILGNYFSGVEDFVKTKGEHREAGTKSRAFGGSFGLFQFDTFKFLPIVHEQQDGPTLAQMQEAYRGQLWLEQHFKMGAHQGYQVWTVPTDGKYRIVAEGAQGGGGGMGGVADQYGAAGAKIEGTFELKEEQELTLVVGVCGGSSPNSNGGNYSGGGGGSFVVADGAPLLVAGGGGGACGTNHGNNQQATDGGAGRKETQGGTADFNGVSGQGAGGQEGAGGQTSGSYNGSGGGGFNGDGQDGVVHNGPQPQGGKSFQGGLRGGDTSDYQAPARQVAGGFGGGGGASLAGPGGGGGYSGGGSCGNWSSCSGYGGGGGSINKGEDQNNTTGGAQRVQQGQHQLADGSITITLL
eukprot:COSAG04_NODE_3202_length_3053_cov_2.417400_2_plen_876_part_00